MEVSLLFKIGAVPDSEAQPKRRAGFFNKSYRPASGTILGPALYLRFIYHHSGFVCAVGGETWK